MHATGPLRAPGPPWAQLWAIWPLIDDTHPRWPRARCALMDKWRQAQQASAAESSKQQPTVSWRNLTNAAAEVLDRRQCVLRACRLTREGQAVALRNWLEREELPPLALDMLDEVRHMPPFCARMRPMHLLASGGVHLRERMDDDIAHAQRALTSYSAR